MNYSGHAKKLGKHLEQCISVIYFKIEQKWNTVPRDEEKQQ